MTSPRLPLGPDSVASLASSLVGRVVDVEPLAGDASTRRFYRVRLADGGTLVAMALEMPADPTSHPQFLVGAYLRTLPFPVPALIASLPDQGLLLYEDLGDLLLQDLAGEAGMAAGEWGHWAEAGTASDVPGSDGRRPAVRTQASSDEIERLYLQAVSLIVTLQGPGTDALPVGHPSSLAALDEARFTFELGFFREHYVAGLRGLRFGPRETRALDAFLASLAAGAASGPRALCHRDYHSRNLIVAGRHLRVIDFQDARMGPVAYDLASLLRDSYVSLPDPLQDRLIEAFVTATPAHSSDEMPFRHRFEVVALQRNLKAIGTFAYQAGVRGKSLYLSYLPNTWAHALGAAGRIPEFADAVPLLQAMSGGL